jgi:hypothetical protein
MRVPRRRVSRPAWSQAVLGRDDAGVAVGVTLGVMGGVTGAPAERKVERFSITVMQRGHSSPRRKYAAEGTVS